MQSPSEGDRGDETGHGESASAGPASAEATGTAQSLEETGGIDVDEGPPVLQNFTGRWKVDDARSDRLDAFFQALGVNWFARKIVCAVDASYQIQHTPASWDQKDITRFGTHHARYLLDGQYHDVPQPGGKVAPARAWQSDTGDVIIETRLPETRGTTVDCRRLVSRTRLQQTLSVWREGRMDHQSRREWMKLETPQERRAARELEAKARHESAKSTVTSSGLCMFGMWKAKAPQIRRQSAASTISTGTGQSRQQGQHDKAIVGIKDARALAAPVLHADFTGDWHIDWNLSEKWGAYLKEIGVPWIARGIAESLEIRSKMKHLPYESPSTLESEDSSKFGTQTTQFVVDCDARTVTGDDGKTIMRIVEPLTFEALHNGSVVKMASEQSDAAEGEGVGDSLQGHRQDATGNNTTVEAEDGQTQEDPGNSHGAQGVNDPFPKSNASRSLSENTDIAVPKWTASLAVYEATQKQLFKQEWSDGINGNVSEEHKVHVSPDLSKSSVPIVGIRMTTVLPDNVGVTVETRHLTKNGEHMRQIHDLFREGQHKVRVQRFLQNRAFDEQQAYIEKLSKARAGESFSTLQTASDAVGDSTANTANASSRPVPSAGGLQDEDTVATENVLPEDEHEFSDVESHSSYADEDEEEGPTAELQPGPKIVHTNFSGIWEVDWGRSQRLDGLFKAMGLNWLARKFVAALDIKYHIAHTPIEWYIREVSSVGVFQLNLLLDGRWHLCKQQDGSQQPMKVTQDSSTGDIEIETMLIYDSHNPRDTKEIVKQWEKKGAQSALTLAHERPRAASAASSRTSGSLNAETTPANTRNPSQDSSMPSASSTQLTQENVQSEKEMEYQEELWTLIRSRCGRLLDIKHLQERTLIRQVLMYETADGVARHAVTRFLMKVESAAERLAAMRLEQQREQASVTPSPSKYSLKSQKKRQDSAGSGSRDKDTGTAIQDLKKSSDSRVFVVTVFREWCRQEGSLLKWVVTSTLLLPEAIVQGLMDSFYIDDTGNRSEEGSSLCALFILSLLVLLLLSVITGTPLFGSLLISAAVIVMVNSYLPLRRRLRQSRDKHRDTDVDANKKER
eukprot:gb/GECG01014938.1/.p1 GENE.gb/GECG01014938.1/~~gb/GECG01014938.1/.p1  ORF type:complete len:1078 (+),score=149.51 gb/GECG01014938.1/:1-3234(+)